jgi:hypothetical protein
MMLGQLCPLLGYNRNVMARWLGYNQLMSICLQLMEGF